MSSRMTGPPMTRRGPMDALQMPGRVANDAARQASLPQAAIDLLGLRTSHINRCAISRLDIHGRAARKRGETDERLLTLPSAQRPDTCPSYGSGSAGPARARFVSNGLAP